MREKRNGKRRIKMKVVAFNGVLRMVIQLS
jgi:hypothetical protein